MPNYTPRGLLLSIPLKLPTTLGFTDAELGEKTRASGHAIVERDAELKNVIYGIYNYNSLAHTNT